MALPRAGGFDGPLDRPVLRPAFAGARACRRLGPWLGGSHRGRGYGFTEYYDPKGRQTVHERYPGEGAELLVHVRSWHAVRSDDVEIVEEFRLLVNLWEDRANRAFYHFDGSGNPIKVAVITDDGVRVLSSYLRRYQAANQMYLALYLDSTRWSDDLPADDHSWEHTDEATILAYYRGDAGLGERPFSRLFGKRLLPSLIAYLDAAGERR